MPEPCTRSPERSPALPERHVVLAAVLAAADQHELAVGKLPSAAIADSGVVEMLSSIQVTRRCSATVSSRCGRARKPASAGRRRHRDAGRFERR